MRTIEWAAGLFEGEGSVSVKNTRGEKHYKHFYITLSSTDLDVLSAFHEIVGGRLTGPSEKPGKKPIWNVTVSGNEAKHAMLKMFPYLGMRRQAKFISALNEIADHTP